MIFYFTGTGNSLQVAKLLANEQKEVLYSVSSLMNQGIPQTEFTLKEDEKIGFIFPVYAFGPPKIILDFINNLKLKNHKDHYIFAVATCGENIGCTMEILKKNLEKAFLPLHSAFSVIMPNNYVFLGMDVDPISEEERKLLELETVVNKINTILHEKQRDVLLIVRGPIPNIITRGIYYLFVKSKVNTKKFYAKDNCISCGICEKVCNTRTIKVKDKPIWGGECMQCTACINLCPVRAIEYGKTSPKRDRYKNPTISIEELSVLK